MLDRCGVQVAPLADRCGAPVATRCCPVDVLSRCGSPGDHKRDLDSLVDDYTRRHRPRKRAEDDRWRVLALEIVVSLAAYGRTPSGAKHSHQQLLPNAVLRAGVIAASERIADLRSAPNFQSLIDIAREIRRAIPGLGTMWIVSPRAAPS